MKNRTRRKSTLNLISCLLVLSAFVRLTVGASQALANDSPAQAQVVPERATAPAVIIPNAGLLTAFQDREARLENREARMADRMQALLVAEGEITQKIAALEKAEAALTATIALADSASETDLTRLTAVYENMAPKDAAALFEQMPPQFAAGFLGMMEPVAAAKVMAGLAPETAYAFSVVLAGRNANVPTQ